MSEIQLLHRRFKLADKDQSGALELSEVEAIAQQMGVAVSSEQAKQQLIALDRNGDHKIDFSEFCQLLGYSK
jgi:Ca2+-binding EF-hand superfamily protein